MREFARGAVVTLEMKDPDCSNVWLVESDLGEHVLLQHPLSPKCLIRAHKELLDKVSPNVKDSSERALDFVNMNSQHLDFNTFADFEAISLYFVVKRKLTPNQKKLLANMGGTIAARHLSDDVKKAMDLIKSNAAILDEFNAMWYRNFEGLFSGRQPITSPKQRSAIFNMAGFVMAELGRPAATNGYN